MHTATTEIYTLSLHDALPIFAGRDAYAHRGGTGPGSGGARRQQADIDRKSTRLNSSHEWISYAVFCLKKKSSTRSRRTSAASRVIICGSAQAADWYVTVVQPS